MRLVMALFLLFPLLAWGQIYQYIDPETGSKKLTNLPPPWYSQDKRHTEPRTVLIVRGNVIDDTGLAANAAATQRELEEAQQHYAEQANRLAALRAAEAAVPMRAKSEATAKEAKRLRDTQELIARQRRAIAEGAGMPVEAIYPRVPR